MEPKYTLLQGAILLLVILGLANAVWDGLHGRVHEHIEQVDE